MINITSLPQMRKWKLKVICSKLQQLHEADLEIELTVV